MRDTLVELAGLLRRRARGEPPVAVSGELAVYDELLRELGPSTDVPGSLRGLTLRPFFLMNGLIHASTQDAADLAFTLEALATGLETFADYLAACEDQVRATTAGLDSLHHEQQRFFAWLLAQLPECGLGLDGILASMKGDAIDQGTAMAIRQILDDGPEALLASPIFTDAEKVLWKPLFDQAPGAFEALQVHLVTTYRVPFQSAVQAS